MKLWLALITLVGCIDSQSVPCGDRLCPSGTICKQLTNPDAPFCATADQLAACDGMADNATCTSGYCHDGVCLPIVCGNNRIDLGEACDDGNTTTGDGTCSGDCASTETCGNGIVDPARNGELNEQCDDANLVSGDGCSSTCAAEQPRWEQIDLAQPRAMNGAALAYDSDRRRVVMFGGRLEDATGESGSAETFEWNGAAWIGITTASHPGRRWHARMVYDSHRHRMVLFGGQDTNSTSTTFADTWEYDGTEWRNLTPASSPPARTYFSMAYDPIRKVAVLFGGNLPMETDDTWEWDGTTWAKQNASGPRARSTQAMAFDPKRGTIVMAGGGYFTGGTFVWTPTQDTWTYDGSWHQVSTATPPPEMESTDLAYDATTGKLVFFGGTTGATPSATTYTDTWAYDGTTWTKIAGATAPGPRVDHALCSDPISGRIVMFGGFTNLNDPTSASMSTWTWTGSVWKQPPVPAHRFHAIAAAHGYDSTHGLAYSYGGTDAGHNATADLWTFDGTSWTPATLFDPGPRNGATGAYDIARGRFVVFGGTVDNSSTLAPNKTWLWTGTAWQDAAPAHQPPPRFAAMMAYDVARKRVVLFGGVDDNFGIFDDTWEWDGTDWHDVSASVRPPARAQGSATYDPGHGVVIANGISIDASSLTFLYRNDVWAWDGTSWTELAHDTPVSNRGVGLLEYAPNRRRIVAAGGLHAGGGSLDDTWDFDGTQWHGLSFLVSPPARGAADSFPTRDGTGVLMFGGTADFDSPVANDDMWRLTFASEQPRELCSIVADNDGDGLSGCADPDCWATCTPLCPPGADCDPSAPKCGDGTCSSLENCRICAQDCTCTAVCGDNFCDSGETHASCPGDCP